MDYSAKLTVFGKHHETKAEIYSQTLETSVDITSKPNEDCVVASVVGPEIVLALADGHWGRDASELAVSKAVDLIRADSRPSKDSETRARLFALFEQVNTELYEIAISAPGAPASETTLIVCHIKETPARNYLYWSSFGDSFLFLLRNGELQQLNSLQVCWLGFLSSEARYVGVASGLETGIEKLESGDTIFLCTDGLVGSDCEPEPSILGRIKDILNSDLPLASCIEQVIASALERGEEDNISGVVMSIV